ncbi:thiamine-phosphate kinase, partial [Angustibacter peucedani]
GRSAAGWALLEAGEPDAAPDLVAAHRRPRPPLAAGPAASVAGATAMLDVSDGLVRDLGRVAAASGVTVDLHEYAVAELVEPLRAVADAVPGASPWAWVLGGGEDHALAATFPRGAALPDGFVVVGEVLPRVEGRPPVLLDGEPPDVLGWDHFRP